MLAQTTGAAGTVRLVAPAEAVQPEGYLSVLRRRRLIPAAGVAAGLVLATLVGAGTDNTYSAQAAVLVRPITTDPFAPNARPSDVVNMATEAEVIRSSPVINLAATRQGLGPVDLASVRERLEVAPAVDALVLDVSYEHKDPKRAAAWAQALAEAYLTHREQQARRTKDQAVGNLDAQIAEVSASLNRSPQTPGLSNRVTELERQRSDLVALPTIAGEILRPAELPTSPSGTPLWVTQLGALALCTLLGMAVAVAVDRNDDRVRSMAEVASIADPLLGSVPRSARVATIPLFAGFESSHTDAYRRLRANLLRSRSKPLRHLLITAPGHGEHAIADLAVHLSMTTAVAGSRTALVWVTSETRPSRLMNRAGRVLPLDPDVPGLSQILSGKLSAGEVLTDVHDLPALRVILPQLQRPPLSPEEMVIFQGILENELLLLHQIDTVILAAPAMSALSDVLQLASLVDGALLAVDPDRTERRDLETALATLHREGVDYLGAVVVGRTRRW